MVAKTGTIIPSWKMRVNTVYDDEREKIITYVFARYE